MGRAISKFFSIAEEVSLHALVNEDFDRNRDTVLCISGFGCSHYNFLEMIKDLDGHYNYVLIDNRGMGQSSKVNHDYLLTDLAKDAVCVMDQLEVEKFHLQGISMGGFVAQLMALEYEKRILSLVLLCTTSGGDEFLSLPEMTVESLRSFYQLPEPDRTESVVSATVHPSLKEEAFGRYQKIVELRRAHAADVEQVLLQKKAVDKFLAHSIPLETIKLRTLILMGNEDRFVNPKNAEILHEKLTNSKLEFIDKSDHLFFLERPRMVGDVVLKFLNENKKNFTKIVDQTSNIFRRKHD